VRRPNDPSASDHRCFDPIFWLFDKPISPQIRHCGRSEAIQKTPGVGLHDLLGAKAAPARRTPRPLVCFDALVMTDSTAKSGKGQAVADPSTSSG
jgi:hypothetical protein